MSSPGWEESPVHLGAFSVFSQDADLVQQSVVELVDIFQQTTVEHRAELQISLPPLFRAGLRVEGEEILDEEMVLANRLSLPSYKAFVRIVLLPRQELADDDADCSICCEEMTQKVTLGCGHCFCFQCILTWITAPEFRTCPLCREMLYRPLTQAGVEINMPGLLLRRNLLRAFGSEGLGMALLLMQDSEAEEYARRAMNRAYDHLEAPCQAVGRGSEILEWNELGLDLKAMGYLLGYAGGDRAAETWNQLFWIVQDELAAGWQSRYSDHKRLSTPGALGNAVLEALDSKGLPKELEAIYTIDADGARQRGLRPGVDPFEAGPDGESTPAFFDWQYTRLTDYVALIATR